MNANELLNATKAGFPYFYIQTNEIGRTVDDLLALYKETDYSPEVWDFENDPDPENALRKLEDGPIKTVVIAKNWNWFLVDDMRELNKQFVTFLQNRSSLYASAEFRKIFIILGEPTFDVAIPNCLQKDFLPLDFGLPTNEQIVEVMEWIIESASSNPKFVTPDDETKQKIVDNSKGLTVRELKNAYAYSIIKNEGVFDPVTVGEIQAREIEKTAGLSLDKYSTPKPIGLDNMIDFVISCILGDHPELAKGILIVGPPGTGKTMFAEYISTICGMKVLGAEMAELFGKFVGESEGLMKAFLDIVKANNPAILFIDEIEKALAGVGGGQTGDGGTTTRSMSQFLKFLSKESERQGIYVIGTCNNISAMPPEWVRAERWDAIFFVDLPEKDQREAIFDHYKTKYDVKGVVKDTKGWSGAEIKSVCRMARMMGKKIDQVQQFIVPVSRTMKTEIEGLRNWAKDRTVPANTVIKGSKRTKAAGRSLEL